jgi:hypothetical protein
VLLHLFSAFTLVGSSLVFEEERLLNISAEKLVFPKSDMRFFPVVRPFSDSRKYISLAHSLPKNVGV